MQHDMLDLDHLRAQASQLRAHIARLRSTQQTAPSVYDRAISWDDIRAYEDALAWCERMIAAHERGTQ